MALVTLDEAKRQLGLRLDPSPDDVELQLYVDALPAAIEGYVGVVEQRQFTDTLPGPGGGRDRGRRHALALLHPPVVAVTSLAGGGYTYPADTLTLDGPAGIVTRTDGAAFPAGTFTVTYTAGRAEVPPTIKLAALMLLQHLWRTQRPSRSGALAGGGDDYSVQNPIPGFGYAVPNRVLELLQPYRLPPGVA
ncbi:head-tail connector protein [Streptomyces sp. NPDC048219]|uniref:head-tail connector protein n=1 Tax=Streptomyces sp. NPDC048219 TaxID=3365517 RepID=UPI0037119747